MTTRIAPAALLFIVVGVTLAGCGETTSPTSPTTTSGPTTATFASELAPRGTASRAFTASAAGSVTVTLTSVSPETTVGVGVGIPFSNGTNCYLSQAVETVAGTAPQLTVAADKGDYCLKLFDPGTLTRTVSFSVTFVHP